MNQLALITSSQSVAMVWHTVLHNNWKQALSSQVNVLKGKTCPLSQKDVVSNMIKAFAHYTVLILTFVSNFRWYEPSLLTYPVHVIPMYSRFQTAHRRKAFSFLLITLQFHNCQLTLINLFGGPLKFLLFTIRSFNF